MLDLLVLHLLGSGDVVVGQLVLLAQLDVDAGSQSHVVGEVEVLLRSEVIVCDYGQGLPEDLELLLVDVAEELLDHVAVDLIYLDGFADLLLDQAQRCVPLTEARQRSLLLIVLDFLLYLCLVVCSLHRDGDDGSYVRSLLNRYSHFFLFYIMYYSCLGYHR